MSVTKHYTMPAAKAKQGSYFVTVFALNLLCVTVVSSSYDKLLDNLKIRRETFCKSRPRLTIVSAEAFCFKLLT